MKYGRYQVIKEIGKGSMGIVYQAHDPNLDVTVALKILRPEKVISETCRILIVYLTLIIHLENDQKQH